MRADTLAQSRFMGRSRLVAAAAIQKRPGCSSLEARRWFWGLSPDLRATAQRLGQEHLQAGPSSGVLGLDHEAAS